MSFFSDLNHFRRQYGSGIIRGALTLGDNLLSYLTSKKPWRGPLYVDWEVTYACNSRCNYCNCWRMAEPEKELGTEEALRVIRELGRSGVWLLIFTGGEPLVRRDLGELIRAAKKAGMNVGLNTNGSLLKKHAEMLVESGLDAVTVTAEGHVAEIHDRIRNFKGSFAALSRGIEELKKHRRDAKPRIAVRMDFTQENYRHLEPYVEYWRSRVDGIIFQPIHQTTATGKYVTQDLGFADEDERSFREYFEGFMEKEKAFSNLYYREIPTFFFQPARLYRKYRCFAGYVFGQIDPHGNVYSCTEYMENFGNLRESSFMQVWTGEKAMKYREIIRDRKFSCRCWYYCTGPVNSYLSRVPGFK